MSHTGMWWQYLLLSCWSVNEYHQREKPCWKPSLKDRLFIARSTQRAIRAQFTSLGRRNDQLSLRGIGWKHPSRQQWRGKMLRRTEMNVNDRRRGKRWQDRATWSTKRKLLEIHTQDKPARLTQVYLIVKSKLRIQIVLWFFVFNDKTAQPDLPSSLEFTHHRGWLVFVFCFCYCWQDSATWSTNCKLLKIHTPTQRLFSCVLFLLTNSTVSTASPFKFKRLSNSALALWLRFCFVCLCFCA